jgi:hypothetical protein
MRAQIFQRRGWRYSIGACPVEQAIAQEFAGKVDLMDWRTMPPFFPGDRSMIVIA